MCRRRVCPRADCEQQYAVCSTGLDFERYEAVESDRGILLLRPRAMQLWRISPE